MHKQEVLDKAKKDIRSVLIINKHGIIADEFEREYKSLVGQKLPLDLMGVTNLDELAALIPEVMKVVQMSNGTTLIQGRVATKIFEVFGKALCKEFIVGREPVSSIHYVRTGTSINRPLH